MSEAKVYELPTDWLECFTKAYAHRYRNSHYWKLLYDFAKAYEQFESETRPPYVEAGTFNAATCITVSYERS